jgi:putative two-component system response regulator
LLADDSEINRKILVDILADEFEIIEAEDGAQAVSLLNRLGNAISLVLLDAIMPNMDGYEVLNVMNMKHWIDEIPVIVISAENRPDYIERAYDLGVSDFISRPFDAMVVRRRVCNTIMLYAKQKKLIGMVADQIYEREKSSDLMVNILSHIVEFRNGESGLHVIHIRQMTELLLKQLVKMTDQYRLTRRDIYLIGMASTLHDIGKIGIPDEILNKPGKLTAEEFEIMKTHAEIGASMLEDMEVYSHEPLVHTAYEICRWHHERYDGRGYPDGLVGEQIPISAQIVSLADVYDALTSVRVYKPAYSHEQAMQMILNGECGAFNPLLLSCLTAASDEIKDNLGHSAYEEENQRELRDVMEEMLQNEELSTTDRTIHLLEQERNKYRFFADLSREVLFEYTCDPPILTLSEWGASYLGLDTVVMEPAEDPRVQALLTEQSQETLAAGLRLTTPEQPLAQMECILHINGQERWHRIICRTTWTEDDPPRFNGAIGKTVDIHEEYIRMEELRRMAFHDALTGLWNHAAARKQISRRLSDRPEGDYALILLDLDSFKAANDNYGHMFGDQVLKYTAERLLQSIRSSDIGARMGGDEFLIFLEYRGNVEPVVERIFQTMTGLHAQFPIHVSMGVALSEQVGTDYDTLFSCADQAMYAAKRDGRGCYRFYEPER